MSETLAQYAHRSPRYILLPQDRCFIRVAGPKQTPWEEGTELRNISKTGLAFTAPDILVPLQGESIRVQFEVPGSKQMACHARVVRIEPFDNVSSLVAIEFEGLSGVQEWNLAQGLLKKKINEDQNVIELNPANDPLGSSPWLRLLFYTSVGLSLFFSSFLLIMIFKFLSDPFWMDKLYELLRQLWVNGRSLW